MSQAITIAQLQALYEQGRYVDALEQSRHWGPLEQWHGAEQSVFAGKLASNLGATRLGRWIHLRNFRSGEWSNHPEIQFCALWAIWSRRGPLVALQFESELPEPENPTASDLADRLAFRAHCHAHLRDFETADRLMQKALEMMPERAWLHVEYAGILTFEDRLAEALEASGKALELQPFYRPAVQSQAHGLVQTNADDQALKLLREAVQQLQSGDVVGQLIALLCEREEFAEAESLLQLAETYYPEELRDKTTRKWLDARRSDILYHRGDFNASLEFARKVDLPFFEKLAAHLEEHSQTGCRKLLDLKFVRQHHVTCAPATLTAISGYWGREVEHLTVAEAICFDGTPAHEERHWANEHGYFTREFRVTWDAAVRLIDAGIPFTLTTIGPGAGHLQPVIGYDSRRRVLLVRDPGERHLSEYLADELLEYFNSTGPRGMAMIPQENAPRLQAIELEDAELYDQNFVLQRALIEHDRNAAQLAYESMVRLDAEHRLTTYARATIAWYDSDLLTLLECTEKLLTEFPDDVNQLNAKARFLGELGRSDARLDLLRQLSQRDKSDPMFWQQYASELMVDHQQLEEAEYWIRRSMRYRPVDPRSMQLLSQVRWEQDRREESLNLQRFAACLDDRNEDSAQLYFSLGRCLGQEQQVLGFLADRFNRFADQSSLPTRTYVSALDLTNQTDRALQVLEEGMNRRQKTEIEGDMLIFASEFYGRCGDKLREKELLESARGHCRKTDWLRAAIAYSVNHGQLPHAEKLLRKVVESEPFDLGSQRWLVQLLSDLHGPQQAEQYLQTTVDTYPFHRGLRQTQVDLFQQEGNFKAAEQVLRHLLAANDRDPWTLRELATTLASQRRNEEALPLAEQAVVVDPNSPESHHLCGAIQNRLGNTSAARESFRTAIGKSIDFSASINSLMRSCDTKNDRLETLQWIHDQLASQHTTGEGLIAYHDHASASIEGERLLKIMQALLRPRQQIWQAWVAVMHRLVLMHRFNEAENFGRRATQRFPLNPQVWLELALVYRESKDSDKEIHTLKQALAVNGSWIDGLRELAHTYLREEQLELAEKCVHKAIRLDPRNPLNLGLLAEVRWQQEQHDEAMQLARQALNRNPGFEQAWNSIVAWSAALGQGDMPLAVVEELRQSHPFDVRPLLMKLELLAQQEDGTRFECQQQTIEQALEIDPRNPDVYYQQAQVWAAQGEIDKALACCQPPIYGGQPPHALRTGKAVVLARSGRLEEAIETMQSALLDDPDDGYGWMQLADWQDAKGNVEGFHEAACQMMRISPNYEVALGYMGDALLKQERRDEAAEHFVNAVKINPDYTFGAIQAFDLLVAQQKFESAEEILGLASFKSENAWKLCCQARLFGMTRRVNLMQNALRDLFQSRFEQGNPIRVAVESLVEHQDSLAANIRRIATEVFDQPETNPQTGVLWGRLKIKQLVDEYPKITHQTLLNELENRNQQSACWPLAISEIVDFWGTQERPDELDLLVEKFRQPLAADNETWAATGQAYQHKRSKMTVRWMADWEDRKNLQPNQILPLVLAYWELFRIEESRPVLAYALRLPQDAATDPLRLFMAIDQMAAGEINSAASVLESVSRSDLPPYYASIYELLVCCFNVFADSSAYPTVIRDFDSIVGELEKQNLLDRIMKFIVNRLKKAMAQSSGRHLTAWAEDIRRWFIK